MSNTTPFKSKSPHSKRQILSVVLLCHFICAFSVLGLAPFIGIILENSLNMQAAFWAGCFYMAPTLSRAIASPWWGRLADRLGSKQSLIRSQLGLAFAFLLAGLASEPVIFFIALLLQGLLGGTYAASNVILAKINATQEQLSQDLTYMQSSARLAVVVAPACVGLLMMLDNPIEMYRYLIILPLIAAFLIFQLRLPTVSPAPTTSNHDLILSKCVTQEIISPSVFTPKEVYFFQFTFTLINVITLPYFILYATQTFSSLTPSMAGLLFGLPHLIFLALGWYITPRVKNINLRLFFATTLLLFAAAQCMQLFSNTIPELFFWRFILGISMAVGFVVMNKLISQCVQNASPGKTFGKINSSSEWAGVFAGLIAAIISEWYGTSAPFYLSAGIAVSAASYQFIRQPFRRVQHEQ